MKNIVQTRLEELNLSAIEAANKAGLERTFIRDIIVGRKKSVRSEKLQQLADALLLDVAALADGELKRLDQPEQLRVHKSKIQGVKVIGKVTANTWKPVHEMDFDYTNVEIVPSIGGYPIEFQFAVIVDGNCLNKIAENGDRLVCIYTKTSGIEVLPGDLVIVERRRYGGEMVERTAKRVRQAANGYELWPESLDPSHQKPIVLSDVPDGEEVDVIGKVIWILRKP